MSSPHSPRFCRHRAVHVPRAPHAVLHRVHRRAAPHKLQRRLAAVDAQHLLGASEEGLFSCGFHGDFMTIYWDFMVTLWGFYSIIFMGKKTDL